MFAENFYRVGWDCVHFLKDNESLPIEEIEKNGIKVFEIDGNKIKKDKAMLLSEVARKMKFPDYFGKNWDALAECLRDMNWLPSKGYILIVKNMRDFWSNVTLAGTFLEIWLFCAQEWSKTNTPFHLVFQP